MVSNSIACAQNVSSRVGCLCLIARGRGPTVTFASVLVQARVSGPGAPPTNTCAFVPALTVSLLLFSSRLRELGFPSASKSNRIGRFSAPPHLSAFGFTTHCGVGPALLCVFLHSLARRSSNCQAVLERVKRQRKGSVGQTERLEMKKVIWKALE